MSKSAPAKKRYDASSHDALYERLIQQGGKRADYSPEMEKTLKKRQELEEHAAKHRRRHLKHK
jgi:hypothetical protein